MALVDSSIQAARSANGDFRSNGPKMEDALMSMIAGVRKVPAYESFVSGTEIGAQLQEDLQKLQEAIEKISEQIGKISSRTESFLDNQQVINRG